MKEVSQLLIPKNIFNLNVLELCKSDSVFEGYVFKNNNNYFSLTKEEIKSYKNVVNPNYFDVIFMDYDLPNNLLSDLFTLINYSLKNNGKCLLYLNIDDTSKLEGFDLYQSTNENFIYKNIDVLGFKLEKEAKEKEEKLKKEKERKEKEEKLKKQIETIEKEKKDYYYAKNVEQLTEKQTITVKPVIEPKIIVKNNRNYSLGSLSIKEKKSIKKDSNKEIVIKTEKPKININKVNIKKDKPKKVKNNINIRPKRGSRPKL